MMKILILGKTGMLGHMVYDYFKNLDKYQVIGFDKSDLDIKTTLDFEIEEKITQVKPDIVINCIGLINVYSNKDYDLSKKINSLFPHFLAYLGLKYEFKLIHLSSDCVFDQDIYGKSKLLGEVNDHHNLTIRTSIIGPELKNGYGLFHWLMSSQENQANGFLNAMWDGVTTLELAKFIDTCIIKNYNGLINYRTKKSISKYELLKIIASKFDKKIEIIPDDRKIKDKRELNSEHWCDKEYEEQLSELLEFMKDKKEYKLYFEK